MTALALDPTGSYRHPDDPGEPTTGNPRLSITDAEGIILSDYAEGARVLEIGTGIGVSTRALASTASAVTTVDIDTWVWETIWPHLPENVTGVIRVPEGAMFDLAFIDGDHHTASVERDVAAALAVVRPGGTILAHDFNYESVRLALDGWDHHDTKHGIGFYTVPE